MKDNEILSNLMLVGGFFIGLLVTFTFLGILFFWYTITNIEAFFISFIILIPNFNTIMDVHLIVVLIGFGVIAGFILGDIYLKQGHSLKFGMIQSFFAILVNLLIFGSFFFLLSYNGFFLQSFQIYDISILTITICSIIFGFLAIISAFFFIKFVAGDRNKINRKKVIKNIGRVIIVLIIVPILIVFLNISTGSIERNLNAIALNITAERTANDTIVITNNGLYFQPDDHISKYLSFNISKYITQDTFFIIYLDGIEASNISEINCNELNLSISPETGLGVEPGKTVKLIGQDVSTINNTNIEVSLYTKDGKCISSTYWYGYNPL